MALSPGTRLGPYEIAAQIGVGGMGEVYQATEAIAILYHNAGRGATPPGTPPKGSKPPRVD